MRNLLRYIGLRHLQRKPLRTLLATMGICLGVALFVAIQILNRSTRASFKDNIESVAGKSSLIISAGEAGFPEDRAAVVSATPGVRHAVPMIESHAFFGGASAGAGETLYVLGVDLLKEQAVRTYKTSDEHVIDDPLVFLNQADSIILTNALAQRRGLVLGSKFTLATALGAKTFTVRGLLSPEGPARAYGGAIAIMDIDGAQATFGKEGRFDRIDAVLADGASIDAVAGRLRAALGPGFQVERPNAAAEAMPQIVASYQLMMTFFSALALVVGLFLVATAVSVSVAERKREIGTLRALGATRRGVLVLFLSESTIMGALGGFGGAWMGRGLAALMLPGAVQSLSAQSNTRIDVTRLQFGLPDVLQAVAIGAVVSLLAALWPAWTATRIQPIEALRRDELGDGSSGGGWLGRSFVVGVAMLAYLTISSALGWGKAHATLDMLNQVSTVVGAALVGPAVVLALVRLLRGAGGGYAGGGTVLRLAEDNLLRSPRRTGGNVMSIMIGLMLVIFIASVSESFSQTTIGWLDRVFQSDLFVTSSGSIISTDVQLLREGLAKKLDGIQGVKPGSVHGVRFIHVGYQGRQLGLKAFDEPAPGPHDELFDVVDRPSLEAQRELFRAPAPEAMVSENFVLHFGKRTGDTLELQTPAGKLEARIAGVVVDFASNVGVVYVSRAVYKKYWSDPLVNGFALDLAPGASADAVRSEIGRVLGNDMNLVLASTADLRRDLVKTIRSSFADARAIETAALFVGLMGLFNTLLVSVMERTREFGMLRAIGMSRRQLARMILAEAMLQGGLSAMVAAGLGVWIAYLWITNSLSHVLGWTVHFHFPTGAFAGTFFVGLIVAWLAGIYPSRRAAGIPITTALSNE